MKIKNQTGPTVLESAPETAANDDSFPRQPARDDGATPRKQAWSPREVWRTRVKEPVGRGDNASR